MNRPDEAIDRFRGRLAFVLTCKHALTLTTFWTFLWGAAILLLRATTTTPSEVLLWGAAALPLIVLAATVFVRRQLPSRSAVRAVLDEQNDLGGMLVAAEEVEVGHWGNRLRVERVPCVHWESRRAWALMMVGAGFVVGGFLMPRQFATAGREAPLEVGHQVRRVKDQVQALKEEKVLEATRAEEMKTKLDQLREEARGTDPARSLEAIDRVQDVAKQKAREAVEAALKKTEQLAKTQSLADLLRKKKKPEDGGLSDRTRAEAMQELARLTRDALRDNESLAGKLNPDLLKDLKDDTLTPEMMQKLAEALRDAKGDIEKMLGKLEKVGLLDPDTLKEAAKAGDSDTEGLLDYLKQNEGKASVKELVRLHNAPGRGGVTRGPAPADISFGSESPELKDRMKQQTLPQARLDALKKSKLSGVSLGNPKKDERGDRSTSGALSGSAGGSGSAQIEVILPRHRGAVERYFERGEKK